jgi:HK97 family phage major capsid protein
VEITEKVLKEIENSVSKSLNDFMEKDLAAKIEDISMKNARKVVEAMLVERSVRGLDRTGLTADQKKDFAAQVISAYKGHESKAVRVTKANEALIEEQDNRGGYLVEPEVAAAILRVAASVGTIMKQCQMWQMKGDELGIPNYTGTFLTGSYIGVDLPGVTTGLTFGQAVLIARKWQLAFTVGNDLSADASVNLGDWLLAIAGEALANMVDQQGFTERVNVAGRETETGDEKEWHGFNDFPMRRSSSLKA